MSEDKCVMCGEYVPEGRQVCINCEKTSIKDSGNRRKFGSGAVRDIQEGKGRCDLLPLDVVAQHGCKICKGGLPCDNGCDGLCDICDIPETGHYNYCPICGRKLGENE